MGAQPPTNMKADVATVALDARGPGPAITTHQTGTTFEYGTMWLANYDG